ncbi:MAG: hypothetical protein IIB66_04310 [Proteobacteria bacterium]|nr:hypothetical protein [Pseudomonadota bacterium]MCH8187920.1 hypothetical protein [Pseudomonadota bacterium]
MTITYRLAGVARLTKGRVLGIALLVLAACQAPVLPPPIPELTYGHLEPINLDVGRIEIVEQYVPPLKAPNVEHTFPTPPATAMRQWAKDRLRAVGEIRTARLVIKNASAIETKLKITGGLRGAFTKDQSERYDVTLDVVLEVRGEDGVAVAFANAVVTRSKTVTEGLSLDERARVFHEMTQSLMDEVNSELEKNIRQFLVQYLR